MKMLGLSEDEVGEGAKPEETLERLVGGGSDGVEEGGAVGVHEQLEVEGEGLAVEREGELGAVTDPLRAGEEGLEGLTQGGLVGRGATAADRTRPERLERVADVVLSGRDAELTPRVPEECLEGTRPCVPGGGEALELGDVDAFVNVLVRSLSITTGIVRALCAGVLLQA